jgi:hypothetical protein
MTELKESCLKSEGGLALVAIIVLEDHIAVAKHVCYLGSMPRVDGHVPW